MDHTDVVSAIKKKIPDFVPLSVSRDFADEIRVQVRSQDFNGVCRALHGALSSPVMMLFAADERASRAVFGIQCVFESARGCWVMVSMDLPETAPWFDSLAKSVYSAGLFEREIKEMFGIEPKGNPDLRRLHLHDEVWPEGNYPLRRDFKGMREGSTGEYKFTRVDGEGIFEVPVGPVHAGIIGPGHFRFSAAGEPIINLEIRLGFTHRGVEKLFEGKTCPDAVRLAECVSGDSVFAHSLAFTRAAEKVSGMSVPVEGEYLRGICLELERMYNHANDIGGIAVDVGFSFPAARAALIKERILRLNEHIFGSRYLKNVNGPGGAAAEISGETRRMLLESVREIRGELTDLSRVLYGSVSFMDRVDTTGILKKKTAEDLGVVGLAARASGIARDLRKDFPGVYKEAGFKIAVQEAGDVLSRLKVRIFEFEESCRLIEFFAGKLLGGETNCKGAELKAGSALGYAEGWRGPVLYWVKVNASGAIERCKIVDPSFHNWQGLSYAVLGDIIPDFPLCNKSFDLSYSGNDL